MTMSQEIKPFDELSFEYDQLRKEILQHYALAIQVLGGTLVLVGAVMAFAGQSTDNPLRAVLFFAAQAIATVAMLQTAILERNMYIVGTYLRTFIEPRTENLRWETRLYELRFHTSGIPKPDFFSLQLIAYALLIVLNFVLGNSVLFLTFGCSPLAIAVGLMVIVLTLCFLCSRGNNALNVTELSNVHGERSRIKNNTLNEMRTSANTCLPIPPRSRDFGGQTVPRGLSQRIASARHDGCFSIVVKVLFPTPGVRIAASQSSCRCD